MTTFTRFLIIAIFLSLLVLSCSQKHHSNLEAKKVRIVTSTELLQTTAEQAAEKSAATEFRAAIREAAYYAGLEENLVQELIEAAGDKTFRASFSAAAAAAQAGDKYLTRLVDKQHALPATYQPDDLVALDNGLYRVNRSGHLLRAVAREALERMAKAATADGITLLVSSAYRSYNYQNSVYQNIVAELGQSAADRESARPGHSQHQLGLAVDFGSITDDFAQTTAGRWLAAKAEDFGWSLSYPQGYETVTGYRWESWHFRYLGKNAVDFIRQYFGGIQQWGLAFLQYWN